MMVTRHGVNSILSIPIPIPIPLNSIWSIPIPIPHKICQFQFQFQFQIEQFQFNSTYFCNMFRQSNNLLLQINVNPSIQIPMGHTCLCEMRRFFCSMSVYVSSTGITKHYVQIHLTSRRRHIFDTSVWYVFMYQ